MDNWIWKEKAAPFFPLQNSFPSLGCPLCSTKPLVLAHYPPSSLILLRIQNPTEGVNGQLNLKGKSLPLFPSTNYFLLLKYLPTVLHQTPLFWRTIPLLTLSSSGYKTTTEGVNGQLNSNGKKQPPFFPKKFLFNFFKIWNYKFKRKRAYCFLLRISFLLFTLTLYWKHTN